MSTSTEIDRVIKGFYCICRSSSHHWIRYWLVTWMVPCHYLNQCWNIVNWTLRNKLQRNFNQNLYIFIQENAFENVDNFVLASTCLSCISMGQELMTEPADALVPTVSGHQQTTCTFRADSRFAPSQWETVLLCNNVSHWLGASLESALWLQCRAPYIHKFPLAWYSIFVIFQHRLHAI